MKSFCIKTNHNSIITHLLKSLNSIPDIIFVHKKFKIYNNIIIHYNEKNINSFVNAISHILTDCVILFYEPQLIRSLINFNYFYFNNNEKKYIAENCYDYILNFEENMYSEEENISDFPIREDIIFSAFTNYINSNKSVILDGFINFRLSDYIKILEEIIDYEVNQYVIEKEYVEFVDLLKIYIDSNESKKDFVHLIYTNGESILLDKNKSIISVTEHSLEAKYLSDITFSSNDYTLNTLLTLLPKTIELHIIGESDDFVHTLELIFRNRISICKNCHICRTYRILNNVSHEI